MLAPLDAVSSGDLLGWEASAHANGGAMSAQSGANGGAKFPTMSDGRMFTDYSTRCGLALPDGMSCHDFKDSMIRNAEDKMQTDRAGAAAAVGGVWCHDARVPGVELIVECNDRACAFKRTGASEPVGISTDNTRLQH